MHVAVHVWQMTITIEVPADVKAEPVYVVATLTPTGKT
jgi:hypothetical protein